MRQLAVDTEGIFLINCECKRQGCEYDFTDSGDLVIFCGTCLNTKIVFRKSQQK